MSYKKTTIGAHCSVTSSKRFHASERTKEGVPFYCSKEIIQKVKGEDVTECDYISEDAYKSVKEKYGVPQVGDLLITTRGTYGVPYIYKDYDKFYFADGNLTWLKDFDDELDVEYLYYWINSYEGQKKIDAIAKGTAQKAVPIATLKQIEIEIPDISTQKKVVCILKAYDELIENNQKQIKLLEEATQRLYKEWFVDFRFPGYKETEIVDGIPNGWGKELVGDIIGKLPRTKQIKATEYLSEGLTPIIDQSRDFIAGYTNENDAIVNVGVPVIVFGDHTRILKYIQFPFAKGADGTQLIISDRNNMPQSLLYLSLIAVDLSNYHYARHFKYLKAESVLVPTQKIADEFDRLVSPMFNQVQKLRDKCNKLSQARDILLPRLMNGEIEV
jgi:type I restriction enzyme S subunit